MVVRESMATERTLGVHGFEKGYNVFSDGRINQALERAFVEIRVGLGS